MNVYDITDAYNPILFDFETLDRNTDFQHFSPALTFWKNTSVTVQHIYLRSPVVIGPCCTRFQHTSSYSSWVHGERRVHGFAVTPFFFSLNLIKLQ
jgi:hypothetical protein